MWLQTRTKQGQFDGRGYIEKVVLTRWGQARQKQHVEPDYSHLLLYELKIYFDQPNKTFSMSFTFFLLGLNEACFMMS